MKHNSDRPARIGHAKRIILMLSGSVFLTLGAVGIFVPVLPTTPFVICAALCYSRSSSRLYEWLKKSKYFGPYIENYRTGAGIPLRNKIQELALLWALLLISVFMLDGFVLKAVLITVGIAVSTHILLLKTRKTENDPPQINEKGRP